MYIVRNKLKKEKYIEVKIAALNKQLEILYQRRAEIIFPDTPEEVKLSKAEIAFLCTQKNVDAEWFFALYESFVLKVFNKYRNGMMFVLENTLRQRKNFVLKLDLKILEILIRRTQLFYKTF